MSDLALRVTLIAALIPSVIFHEVSHGAVAYAFGDDTAKRAGRLTLNPIPHIDPFGSVILPAILAFTSFGAFGYAKPVPVNPRQLRNPRNHSLLVSLAGPATNIVLAILAVFVARFLDVGSSAWQVAVIVAFINVVLAVFNMLPVPPLDGSALIERILPRHWWPAWLRIRQYSMGVLILVVLLAGSYLGSLFQPFLELVLDIADGSTLGAIGL